MGASLSRSEYSLKVTDVTLVRTLNAIAKNILVQPDLSERDGYHWTKVEEQSTVLYDTALTFSGQDSHSLCFKSYITMENVSKKKKNLKQITVISFA